MNVWSQDRFEFWQTGIFGDRWNLTLKDGQGEDVLRLYGVHPEQLAELSLQIGEILERAPDLTRQHLHHLRDELTRMIGPEETNAVDLDNIVF